MDNRNYKVLKDIKKKLLKKCNLISRKEHKYWVIKILVDIMEILHYQWMYTAEICFQEERPLTYAWVNIDEDLEKA